MRRNQILCRSTEEGSHLRGIDRPVNCQVYVRCRRGKENRLALRFLKKPEYIWQPRRILKRLFGKAKPGVMVVTLPWGLPLEIDTREAIGRAIYKSGVFELNVVEAIFRLVDPNELSVDIGANIGLVTAAFLGASGGGRVVAFEPHPRVFEKLSKCAQLWRNARADVSNRLVLEQLAVSDATGTSRLCLPGDLALNFGLASLRGSSRDGAAGEGVEVRTIRLDNYFDDPSVAIGVLKIDIEGHEPAAFEGARGLLQSHRIRDIIFEDHEGFSSLACRTLRDFGYAIFYLEKTILGVRLNDNDEKSREAQESAYEAPNYLATLNPRRAIERMRGFGCKSLAQNGK